MTSQAFHLQAIIFVFILIVYVLTAHVIENRKVPYMHESSISILMGMIIATMAKYALNIQIYFSNDLFFTIILPPMIFSAGYSLRKSLFFQNFGMISFLGVIGTVLGFLCLSFFIIIINNVFFDALTLTEVFILSSVLCATDTVASMSLIKAEKYPVLNAVLFGQSILNDAVAIILFGTVSKLKLDETGGQFTFQVVSEMFYNFCYLFFFSITFGTFTGFGLSYLFKIYESFNKHPIKETSLILLNGYLTYLLGELLGLSGIITLFTCAIIMGHYSFMNISEESQRGTGLAFETVSYIAEAFVFTYLGASILSIEGEGLAVVMALLILLIIPVIRAIMVYIVPVFYKILNKKFILTDKELKICWYSGMIRGVIAFALCLQIDTQHKKYILTVALVIVMITTLVGSSFMKTFARSIGMDEENQQRSQDTFASEILSSKTHHDIMQREKTNRPEIQFHPEFEGMESQYEKKSMLNNQFKKGRILGASEFGQKVEQKLEKHQIEIQKKQHVNSYIQMSENISSPQCEDFPKKKESAEEKRQQIPTLKQQLALESKKQQLGAEMILQDLSKKIIQPEEVLHLINSQKRLQNEEQISQIVQFIDNQNHEE